jgi:predicted nucleic acid-binding protein
MNILDSSVFLASIFNERGGEFLKKLSKKCMADGESIFIHQVNFLEVVYKVKCKAPDKEIGNLMAEFSSPWWGKINYMDSDLMLLAAELKSKYRQASLGDSIGLATTKIFKGVFWTADSLLDEIGKKEGIAVQLIR